MSLNPFNWHPLNFFLLILFIFTIVAIVGIIDFQLEDTLIEPIGVIEDFELSAKLCKVKTADGKIFVLRYGICKDLEVGKTIWKAETPIFRLETRVVLNDN